jgi:iron(II)-dependent oxidoreductase
MKLNTIASFPKWSFGQNDAIVDELDGGDNEHAGTAEPAEMAFVPAGETVLVNATIDDFSADTVPQQQAVYVDAFYMDRFAVTNADYLRFVECGGYSEMELWPKEIWASLLQFVDQTGKPGPRYWKQGRPEKKLLQHPVTGVCWFEANAYARWNNKQLPNSSQWQRAGTWSADNSEGQARYPWPGGFQASKANIWISGKHATVAVDQFYEGCTANGIYQLVGNVWEWVSTKFSIQKPQQPDQQLNSNLIEIRGGAFDTYLETQATCLFRTGQPYSFRGRNVGFRCCKKTADSMGS